MPLTQVMLLVGSGFFLFEAVIHGFGLPVLEHDKIFLFTHDRYIALYALTMAAIMLLAACNPKKNKALFFIVMGSVLLGMLNAMLIAKLGGYAVLFPPAAEVDGQLSGLGIGAVIWYLATWFAYAKESR